MLDAERFALRFGPYRTPRYQLGQIVECARRGEVQIIRTSDGRIPWPIGKPPGLRGSGSLVLYGDLARAVKVESAQAVRYWWGVGASTVQQWRRVLYVPRETAGTKAIRKRHTGETWFKRMQTAAWAKARDPGRRAKIAAARRGKPRPKHVIDAMRAGHLGKPLSKEWKRKLSEAHKRRGTRPPWLNKPWESWEDDLLRGLPPAEVVERTGRTMGAVTQRRRLLGLPDGRSRAERQRLGR